MKELFLDTKGACFLCLKEILNTGSTETSNTESKEVCLRNVCRYLNVNPCAILLKSLHGVSEEEEKEDDSLLPFQRNKCDFSVLLCTTCASMTNKLSTLIRELELAKMLIHSKIREFYQVLTTPSEENDHCLRNVEGDKISDINVEARLVQHLREETKKKCSAKIQRINKNSVPKVRLSQVKSADRCNVNSFKLQSKDSNLEKNKSSTTRLSETSSKQQEDDPIATFSTTDPLTESSNSAQNTNLQMLNSVDNHSSEVENSSQAISMEMEVSAPRVFQPNKSTSQRRCSKRKLASNQQQLSSKEKLAVVHVSWNGKYYKLPVDAQAFIDEICAGHFEDVHLVEKAYPPGSSITVPAKRCLVCNSYFKSEVYHHIVNNHPEKFFSFLKLEHLSEELFRTHCEVAFNLLTDQRSQVVFTYGKKGILCPICNLRFCDDQYLRYHLVMKHYASVQEKLMCLQQEGGVEEENVTTLNADAQHSSVISSNATTAAISTTANETWTSSSQSNLHLVEDTETIIETGEVFFDQKPVDIIVDPSLPMVHGVDILPQMRVSLNNSKFNEES